MKVVKEFCFSAAHSLAKVDAEHKCRELHGHNYRIRIECSGPLDARDMVIDFDEIKLVVAPIVRRLDHKYINTVVGYDNTTSEWLCQWLAQEIGNDLPGVCAIEVWETDTCGARLELPCASS